MYELKKVERYLRVNLLGMGSRLAKKEFHRVAVSHRSEATRLLGLKFRIHQETWLPLSCEYCLLSDKGLCGGPILCPEVYFRVSVTDCDQVQQETSAPTIGR